MDTYHFRKQIRRFPGKVIHTIPLPEPEVTSGNDARREIGVIRAWAHITVNGDLESSPIRRQYPLR